MKKDNIVLIGLPGAGKSTLGVVLAKMVNYRFLDCDLMIQEHAGKTLQEIIDERGPQGFLQVENDELEAITANRTVISTGGSAVYSEGAMAHLREIGTVVHLRVSYDEMVRRLGDLDERGVVLRNGKVADLRDLYEERMPLYESLADITIEVSDAMFREAAIEIKGILEGRGVLEMQHGMRREEMFRHWRSSDMIYQMERQATFDMLDCNRHLRPTEALRVFGDVANADFAELGFTHRNMLERGFFFIVTRANCHLLESPRDEGRITVRTWPYKVKGMQVTRNFEMLDATGRAIAFCEMVYLIMDANSGHPIRIMDFPLMQMYSVDRAVECLPMKRIRLTDDMHEVARREPGFSDLDVNGHVNNTRYPTFAFDALPESVRNRRWTDFQVEFAAEMHLGDQMVLFANDVQAAVEAGEWVKVVGTQPDGATNFGCLFKFE